MRRVFTDYLMELDQNMSGGLPPEMGEDQLDPDKPDQADDLISALKNIIDVAKKALNKKSDGLADMSAAKDNDEDKERNDMSDLVSRPSADGPAAQFGMENDR